MCVPPLLLSYVGVSISAGRAPIDLCKPKEALQLLRCGRQAGRLQQVALALTSVLVLVLVLALALALALAL
eukprot:445591-Lingulodinium_polyedra.AAC.1